MRAILVDLRDGGRWELSQDTDFAAFHNFKKVSDVADWLHAMKLSGERTFLEVGVTLIRPTENDWDTGNDESVPARVRIYTEEITSLTLIE